MSAPADAQPPADADQPGVRAALNDVVDGAKALVRLEIELAQLELKRKLAALGAGVALFVVAAVLALYALGFALATLAAALATFLSVWLALLIVTLLLAVLVGALALVGRSRIRAGTPPVPVQAIEEARKTSAALRGDGTA